MSRRSFLRTSAALGGAAATASLLRPSHERLLETALASDQATVGSLSDIDHIVILMQENRSFDHYFGTLSDGRGFSDPDVPMQQRGGSRLSVFNQFGPDSFHVGADPYLQPFELVSHFPKEDGQTTNDITHNWGPQHVAWNSGAMDQFFEVHLASDGATNGFLTMGYFTRADLPFYHALADAFTVCDQYFCSVIGPTYPNRLMQMTGSLGADGSRGGPVLETYDDPVSHYGTMDWLTMPEVLTEAGVSWKVYQDPTSSVLFNVLPFFKSYSSPTSSRDLLLASNGLSPQYPAQFEADVASGTLPAVSWIMPSAACCEHPAAPPEFGEWFTSQVLSTLVSNPDVWAKTVLLVVYDENGGFFDHVPPPTPGPVVTSRTEIPSADEFEGEYITAALPSSGTYSAGGANLPIYGPVGLGFRTPCLVISPFSRGGYLCSEVLDHVSVLKLLARRFGTPVPNASAWRLRTVGDMTGALALSVSSDASMPSLPPTSLADPEVAEQAVINAILGTEDYAPVDYPAPTKNSGVPRQENSPARIRLPLAIPEATSSAASSVASAAAIPAAGPGATGSTGPKRAAVDDSASTPNAPASGSAADRGRLAVPVQSSVSASGGSTASSKPNRARGAQRADDKRASALPAGRGRGEQDDTGLIAGVAGGLAAVAATGAGLRRWKTGGRALDQQMEDRAVGGEPLDVEP